MTKKTIAIILLLAAAGLAAVYFLKRNKKPTYYDGEGSTIIQPKEKPETNKAKLFFKKIGFGDEVLNMLSVKDAAIAMDYVLNYKNKGVPFTPGNPMWKDVVRIASYSKLFPKPTFQIYS